jgi:hypothetical protein
MEHKAAAGAALRNPRWHASLASLVFVYCDLWTPLGVHDASNANPKHPARSAPEQERPVMGPSNDLLLLVRTVRSPGSTSTLMEVRMDKNAHISGTLFVAIERRWVELSRASRLPLISVGFAVTLLTATDVLSKQMSNIEVERSVEIERALQGTSWSRQAEVTGDVGNFHFARCRQSLSVLDKIVFGNFDHSLTRGTAYLVLKGERQLSLRPIGAAVYSAEKNHWSDGEWRLCTRSQWMLDARETVEVTIVDTFDDKDSKFAQSSLVRLGITIADCSGSICDNNETWRVGRVIWRTVRLFDNSSKLGMHTEGQDYEYVYGRESMSSPTVSGQDEKGQTSPQMQTSGRSTPLKEKLNLDGEYGSLVFHGVYESKDIGATHIYDIETLNLRFIPNANTNRTDSITLKQIDIQAAKATGKENGFKPIFMFKDSQRISVHVDASSPTAQIERIQFRIPKDILEQSSDVQVSVQDERFLWPVAYFKKTNEPATNAADEPDERAFGGSRPVGADCKAEVQTHVVKSTSGVATSAGKYCYIGKGWWKYWCSNPVGTTVMNRFVSPTADDLFKLMGSCLR